MSKDNPEFKVSILQVEALQLIGKQLLGIREELHGVKICLEQANKLAIEKQKADLDGLLTKAEKELIRGTI